MKGSYYERRKNAPDGLKFMAERSSKEIINAKKRKTIKKAKKLVSSKAPKSQAERSKEYRQRNSHTIEYKRKEKERKVKYKILKNTDVMEGNTFQDATAGTRRSG